MCGRYTQTASPQVIAEHFHLDTPPVIQPRYNIAPSQPVAVVRLNPESAQRECVMLRWGLVPSWAKDLAIGSQCINAKAETVDAKPSFRAAFKTRRCLVIADGFYEWKPQGRRKQPMWIGLRDRRPFAFAGLWEQWHTLRLVRFWKPARSSRPTPTTSWPPSTTECRSFLPPLPMRPGLIALLHQIR